MSTSTGYGAALLRADGAGIDGIRANRTYGTGTSQIVVQAIKNGTAGNSITLTFTDPVGNNVPLSVAVSGNDITVTLATDGSSAVTSKANQVIALLNSNVNTNSLISAKAGTSGGGGVVAAAASQALTGGALATHGFTKISGLRNFSHSGVTTNVVDATSADSPDRFSQKQVGFISAGNISFEMIFDAADASQATMEADWRNGAQRLYRLTLADDDTTTFDFRGFVANFDMSVQLEEVTSRSCTIELTGPMLRNYGS